MEHEPVKLVSPGAEQDFETTVDVGVSYQHWIRSLIGVSVMQTIELQVGSGDAYGEEFAVFKYKLALVQGSADKMNGRVWKGSECIAWSLRSSLLI